MDNMEENAAQRNTQTQKTMDNEELIYRFGFFFAGMVIFYGASTMIGIAKLAGMALGAGLLVAGIVMIFMYLRELDYLRYVVLGFKSYFGRSKGK